MIYVNTFNKREYEGIVAYSGDDISLDMIEECFKLDDQFFHNEFIYDREIVKKWLQIERRLCFVIFDKTKNKVIGYTFLFPISADLRNKYLKKQITYLEMKENDVIKLEPGFSFNLIYASEAFYPGYGLEELHKIINEILAKSIGNLAINDNIAIRGILFDAVCSYDEKTVNLLKLHFVQKTKNDTNIYYNFFKPEELFKDTEISQTLKLTYERKEIKNLLKNEK